MPMRARAPASPDRLSDGLAQAEAVAAAGKQVRLHRDAARLERRAQPDGVLGRDALVILGVEQEMRRGVGVEVPKSTGSSRRPFCLLIVGGGCRSGNRDCEDGQAAACHSFGSEKPFWNVAAGSGNGGAGGDQFTRWNASQAVVELVPSPHHCQRAIDRAGMVEDRRRKRAEIGKQAGFSSVSTGGRPSW